jgi:hypothetical protein
MEQRVPSELEILALDPRAELARIRAGLVLRLEAGQSVDEVLRQLAQRDRVALVDLFLGPRARPGGAMVLAALTVVEALEASVSAGALYRRLADLAGDQAREVLSMAIGRHPEAGWLVNLSGRIEGAEAGVPHLIAISQRPEFGPVCEAYARAGFVAGLVHVAAVTVRMEPLLALASVGAAEELALAAARMLEIRPRVPIVAWLAAVWGPDLEPLLLRVVSHLRQRTAWRALREQARHWPETSALLDELLSSSAGLR